MKILYQFFIILLFTFLGEVVAYLLPFNFPGNILGLIFMFVALLTNVIKVEYVKDVGGFLKNNMSLMFVPLLVGLIDSFDLLKDNIIAIIVILFVTTLLTFLTAAYSFKEVSEDE